VNRSRMFPVRRGHYLGIGRLDNRAELISGLRDVLAFDPPTLPSSLRPTKSGAPIPSPSLSGIGRSSTEPQQSLVDPRQRPIGTRHLYYSIDTGQIAWCTILDPLVRLPEKPSHSTKNTSPAGSLASAVHLTPALAFIPSHRPLSCSSARKAHHQQVLGIRSHEGNPLPCRCRIRRALPHRLCQSHPAQTPSDCPVLAELSGGRTPPPSSAWQILSSPAAPLKPAPRHHLLLRRL